MARVTAKKAPAIMKCENSFCAGCGHAIFDRILGEVLTEMDIIGDTIVCSDIGCNHMFQYSMAVDTIVPPHGKMGAGLCAMKKVRPDKYCLTIAGDGGAYAIGLGETMASATRGDNVTFFVMNNSVYGMTGGQLAPTTQIGQWSASTPNGRTEAEHGKVFDVVKVMKNLDISYLARTTITKPSEIAKTKNAVRAALEKQRDGKGFSLVEVLVPCPTNWGMTPAKAMEWIDKEFSANYEMGVIIDK